MRNRELVIPCTISDEIRKMKHSLGIAESEDDEVFLEIQERLIKKSFENDYGSQFPERNANFDKGIFSNENHHDWALLFYLLGRFVPEVSYKVTQCLYCEEILSEIHLVEKCKKFSMIRDKLISELLKLEIRNLLSVHELVINLQFNEDIYNLTKQKRMILLNLIKQFINEIRESYLKKIKENSNILILANVS